MTESEFNLLWEREVEWLKQLRTRPEDEQPEPYSERETNP